MCHKNRHFSVICGFFGKTTACMTGCYLIRWLWIIELHVCLRFWNHIISSYRNDFGDDLCTPLAVSACHFSQVFVFTSQFASSLGQTWWEWNHLLRCRVAKIGINATPENRWSAKWRKSSMFKAFESFVTQRHWRSPIFLSFLAQKVPGWLMWQFNVWDVGGLCDLAITLLISQFWRNGVFQKRMAQSCSKLIADQWENRDEQSTDYNKLSTQP
jgi:hypothetical protein